MYFLNKNLSNVLFVDNPAYVNTKGIEKLNGIKVNLFRKYIWNIYKYL